MSWLQRRLTTQCSICNGPSATHLHYGAVACYSCRAFFRRGIGKPYCCVEGTGDCSIDLTNRRSCQWCRFDRWEWSGQKWSVSYLNASSDRCLKAGMKPELVDASFRRKTFNKKHNASFEEPILIDNFRPLEKDDISDFLQVFWNLEMQILFLSREEASAAHLLCQSTLLIDKYSKDKKQHSTAFD